MRQTSKYLKGLAREALLQRYSTAVGAYLILFLFTLFQYLLPMQIVLENEIATLLVNQLISLLLTLILFVFQAGAICLILNMSRQREYRLSDLLYAFRHNPDTFLLVGLAVSLIRLVCQLPAAIYNFTSPIWELSSITYEQSMTFLGCFAALSLAGSLVSFLLTTPLFLAPYLLIDDCTLSARAALVSSIRLMRGRKRHLIYLQISFFGMLALGALSCGVALLWVQPYMTMTMVFFYRQSIEEIA